MVASVFFSDSITAADLHNKYSLSKNGGPKIKILIVPGHEKNDGGTEFMGIREAELNVLAGEELALLFRQGGEFEVVLSRGKDDSNQTIEKYLRENRGAIESYIKAKVGIMNSLVEGGGVSKTVGVIHNRAVSEMVLKLYGINKWANENGIDIVLHIHFNDYFREYSGVSGEYSGFAVYVPEKQYSNSKASIALAQPILQQLSRFYPISNLPKEDRGIVEDQKLIAVGAYNTLDTAGILIEYGYIYEPQFVKKAIREKMIKDLAFQTYLGLERFFGVMDGPRSRGTSFLPHTWNNPMEEGTEGSLDVLSLQAALVAEGLYPPAGFDFHDCPLTGNFKNCTALSVKKFKEKYGLSRGSFIRTETIKKLNELFSQ